MKKILKKVGEDNIGRGVKEALKKSIPDSKVVMGRAKRGLFAGRHIQFGNQVSEDGGNKYDFSFPPYSCFCTTLVLVCLLILECEAYIGFSCF